MKEKYSNKELETNDFFHECVRLLETIENSLEETINNLEDFQKILDNKE